MNVRRFSDNPIIGPNMDERMGDNINGPSLIRVPEWIPDPLGKFYLYFAHHHGTYIRLAYADDLKGPWQLYTPGVLDLADSFFTDHIASPDVHVLDDCREIRMYYHGCCQSTTHDQTTRLATSSNGLDFSARPTLLGSAYWRVFHWEQYWYALEMPGRFSRSLTGVSDFEQGPCLFTADMRHCAVQMDGDNLIVFYSNAHDCPERILWAAIPLGPDWHQWQIGNSGTLLTAETEFEGADCSIAPSQRGCVHHRVHQLRDPCVFEDQAKRYLLYSVAGESGIAIGELTG